MVKLVRPNLYKTGYEYDGGVKIPDLEDKLGQSVVYLVAYNRDTDTLEMVNIDSDGRLFVSSGAVKTNDGNISRVITDETVQVVLADNPDRKKFLITNIGIETVYIGFTDTVDIDTGFPIEIGAVWEDDSWTGVIYAISTAVESELAVIEMS